MQERLFWHVSGDKQKPALVLVHGWGSSHRVWLPLVPILREHFCVYCVDLPGYGQSPNLGRLSLSELSELIYQQAPKNAIWLGWSLGGLIATQVALVHQSEMRGLMTVASSPCFIEKPDWAGMSSAVFGQFQANLLRLPKKTREQFLLLQVLGEEEPKNVRQHLQETSDMDVDIEVLVDGLAMLEQTDFRSQLSRLVLPQRCFLGDEDKIVPCEISQSLLSLSAMSVVVLEGASHVGFYSQRERFCEGVVGFLGGI